MIRSIPLQGFGSALAGLDWIELPGAESVHTELGRLVRSAEATWQYVWKGEGANFAVVATKAQSKKVPRAAAPLLRNGIQEDSFLVIVDVGDGLFWLFGQLNGVPVKRMDHVDGRDEIRALAKDFLSSLPQGHQRTVPVYTDTEDLLSGLPYELDKRVFSLALLVGSLTKKAANHANFTRYRRFSMLAAIVPLVIAVVAGGLYVYQDQLSAEQRALLSASKRREAEENARRLERQIADALNDAPAAKLAVPAYLSAISGAPVLISGWKLTAIKCEIEQCVLAYARQDFATWRGYIAAKPASWPDPILTNVAFVEQPIPVRIDQREPLLAKKLAAKSSIVLDIGELAQTAKALDADVQIDAKGQPLVSKPSVPGAATVKVPLRLQLSVKGIAPLLRDIVGRLPDATTVKSLTIKVDANSTYDLQGNAYAHP